MNRAAVDKKVTIALQEESRSETLAGILHLWVGESEPDLLYLILGKETVDDFDIRAKERHILESFMKGLSGSCPHSGTLDVNAYEVYVRVALCQSDSILSLAAAELEDDGVVVMEKLLPPVSFHVKWHVFHYRKGVLEHVLIGCHVGELR